ncbi:hypothetical protein Poli38472_005155 [Pythium oligandrum]|uniref:Rab-GAP TBC domain-containing protein n=1 Tax=Pythium oligandrum TaxID=41045 RepID=A0A8K1FK78_PYTOL|nr:hypothetical protein Poli38472_005155 [Pythium oligandrum]|eukprot:TMW62537.1 hypothetical protein Poli38472_005155 [Pythium oligandrum]
MTSETETRMLGVLLLLAEKQWLQIEEIEALAQTSRGWKDQVRRHRLRRRVLALTDTSASCRYRYWIQRARVNELCKALEREDDKPSYFLELLGLHGFDEKALLESNGVDGEIGRDIDRTFPLLPFFSQQDGDGQRQLGNVLKAIAIHTPEISYCQGMNYVTAVLLILCNDPNISSEGKPILAPQEATFWIMTSFIQNYGMDDMWKSKMPGLSRCIYLYQQLLQKHFYDLHVHLRNIGMHPSLIATQWFATMFARVLSIDVLLRVWDLVLLDGWKMIYRIALAITAHLRPQIISLDMEACSEYFRNHSKLQLYQLSANELIASAFSYKITNKMLATMEEERNLEYLRLRLQKAPLSYEHSILFPALQDDSKLSQSESLNLIRTQLAQYDNDTADDMRILRQKIETWDRTIAQATSVMYQNSYALTEVTFALRELKTVKRELRRRFEDGMSSAIAEASSPSSSLRSKQEQQARGRGFFNLWTPSAATLEYIQLTMAGCFERIPILGRELNLDSTRSAASLYSPTASSTVSTGELDQSDDFNDERIRDQIEALPHLEVLVPHLILELRALLRKLMANEKELRIVQRKYEQLHRVSQLAQIELEEAQDFKDRLSDQMLQLMLENERQKNRTMQELFAKVDQDGNAAESPKAEH